MQINNKNIYFQLKFFFKLFSLNNILMFIKLNSILFQYVSYYIMLIPLSFLYIN